MPYRKQKLFGQIKPPLGAVLDWGDPINNGLVGRWLFNEGAGNKVRDLCKLNHGTLTNMAYTGASGWLNNGKFGPAIKCDGTNDHINFGDVAPFQFEYTSKFSLVSWFRTTLTGTDEFVMSKNLNSGTFRGYLIDVQANKIIFSLQNTNVGNGYSYVTGVTTVTDGRWHQVVCTYSGTGGCSGELIYVDGREDGTTVGLDQLGSRTILSAAPLIIGGRQSGGVPFNGSVDNASVYNRVLKPSEIARLYTEPFAGIVAPRIGMRQSPLVVPYWAFARQRARVIGAGVS